MWHLYRFTPDDADRARELFAGAIARDPSFSSAYSGLAYQQLYDVMNGYSDDFELSLSEAERNVHRALGFDDKDALARFTLGRLYTLKPDYDAAINEFERGMALNPGLAQIYHGMGFALAFCGRPAEAIPYFEKAIRLSPQDPHLTSFMAVRAYAYLSLRSYEKAIESADSSCAQANAMVWPRIFSHLGSGAHRRPAAGSVPGGPPDLHARSDRETGERAVVLRAWARIPRTLLIRARKSGPARLGMRALRLALNLMGADVSAQVVPRCHTVFDAREPGPGGVDPMACRIAPDMGVIGDGCAVQPAGLYPNACPWIFCFEAQHIS